MATKKKNGFYSFLKQMQRQTPGWEQKTNAELMELVSPIWCAMGAEEKAGLSLSNSSLNESYGSNTSRGFDSYGRSLDDLAEKSNREAEEKESMWMEIKEGIDQSVLNKTLERQVFFLIHTNVFCVTDEGLVVPAELSVARMSLLGGVEEVFHCFIEPGPLPKGYRADCVENAAVTHKLPLDLHLFDPNYHEMVEKIILLLSQDGKSSSPLPPLFCQPKYRQQNRLVLDWLLKKSGLVSPSLRLFSLPILLSQLIKVIPNKMECRVPTVSIAELQLDRDLFLYTPGLACDYHSEVETVHCTTAIVRRWVYIICGFCCPALGLELREGYHVPPTEDSLSCGSTSDSVLDCSTNRSQDLSLRGWASEQEKAGVKEPDDWEWEGLAWQGQVSTDVSFASGWTG